MKRADTKFDLASLVSMKLGRRLKEHDILVVSSKFVAISEGRRIQLDQVKASNPAKRIGRTYHMNERLCELVIRESDFILGGVPGFLLTIRGGLLIPNAGIDKSNVRHGMVVMYPRDAAASARKLREALLFELGVNVAVIVCDSRLMPMRRGTTGVALSSSGLEAIIDMRGRRDLFGNTLKVTAQAIADDLSSASQILMGESNESVPIVLVRGLRGGIFKNVDYGLRNFSISPDECVYFRSFDYSVKNGQ